MRAFGRSQFEVKCSGDPVERGAALEVMHTSDEKKSAVFSESVEYRYGVGHTLNVLFFGVNSFARKERPSTINHYACV